eukprot:gene4770-biopygen16070
MHQLTLLSGICCVADPQIQPMPARSARSARALSAPAGRLDRRGRRRPRPPGHREIYFLGRVRNQPDGRWEERIPISANRHFFGRAAGSEGFGHRSEDTPLNRPLSACRLGPPRPALATAPGAQENIWNPPPPNSAVSAHLGNTWAIDTLCDYGITLRETVADWTRAGRGQLRFSQQWPDDGEQRTNRARRSLTFGRARRAMPTFTALTCTRS